MNSPGDGVVEIDNRFLGTRIRLDMSDQSFPTRTGEQGDVETAGVNNELWVMFGSSAPGEGDFFRPFASIEAAAGAVADGGVLRLRPGRTSERPTLRRGKRLRVTAPVGGVSIGSAQ